MTSDLARLIGLHIVAILLGSGVVLVGQQLVRLMLTTTRLVVRLLAGRIAIGRCCGELHSASPVASPSSSFVGERPAVYASARSLPDELPISLFFGRPGEVFGPWREVTRT